MSSVDDTARRYRAALTGTPDPAANTLMRRVARTLDRSVRPLSGVELRARTKGGNNQVQAAVRAMTEAGLLQARPRLGKGGGTAYTLPGRHTR